MLVAVVAESPISMAARIERIGSLVQQEVISLISAYHQIFGAVVEFVFIDVVDDRPFRQRLANRFLGNRGVYCARSAIGFDAQIPVAYRARTAFSDSFDDMPEPSYLAVVFGAVSAGLMRLAAIRNGANGSHVLPLLEC